VLRRPLGQAGETFRDETVVADETRRQRRDARRAAGEQPASEPRGVPQPAAAGGAPMAPIEQESRRRGGFIRESWAELQKVDWPNRAQVIQGTVVVIIAVIIVGTYLWGLDQVFRPFVRNVLLGQ
jgi:preprotein translocase subunit SecE